MSVNRFAETSPDSSPDYSAIGVDTNSKTLLSQYFKDSIVGEPLKTTGDGDCLFNAASILLVGNESICHICHLLSRSGSFSSHSLPLMWLLSSTRRLRNRQLAICGCYTLATPSFIPVEPLHDLLSLRVPFIAPGVNRDLVVIIGWSEFVIP